MELLTSLQILFKQGLSLQECIHILPDYLSKAFPKKVYSQLQSQVQQGQNLIEALATVMPKQKYLNLSFQVLPNASRYVKDLKTMFEQKKALKDQVYQAFAYPLCLLLAIVFLAIFVLNFVMPRLEIGTVPHFLLPTFWGLVSGMILAVLICGLYLNRRLQLSSWDAFLWQMALFTAQSLSLKEIVQALAEIKHYPEYQQLYRQLSKGGLIEELVIDVFKIRESDQILFKKAMLSEDKAARLQEYIQLRLVKKQKLAKQLLTWMKPALLVGGSMVLMLVFLMIYWPILGMMGEFSLG